MSPSPTRAQDAAYAEKLLAVFEAQDDQGHYTFEDGDVRHLVPALALMAGWQPSDLQADTPLARLMDEFREAVGLDEDADAAAWDQAAAAFYAEAPPDAALLEQLRQAMRTGPST